MERCKQLSFWVGDVGDYPPHIPVLGGVTVKGCVTDHRYASLVASGWDLLLTSA